MPTVNKPDSRPDAEKPAVGVLDEPVAGVYDWKLSLKAAGKMALIGAAGVFLADTTGLSAWLTSLLPPEYKSIGALVIASALAYARNWWINRKK